MIWETFAKGIRTQFKDEYYNSKVKMWDLEFKKNLCKLSLVCDELEKLINLDDYPTNNYTPEQIKMLNTTIGSYLRG